MILIFLTFDIQYPYLEYSQSEGSYMYIKALVAIFILLDFEVVENSIFWLVDVKINENILKLKRLEGTPSERWKGNVLLHGIPEAK
jgi:hypothetical protein